MKLKYVDKIRANISINASKKSSNLLDGLYKSIYKGRSMDFDDLRDYVLGDNNKDIDWKSSIRHGSLLVRRYVALKRHNVAFVIDTGTKMAGLNKNNEEKRETIMNTVGTLGFLVNKNEDEICTVYGKEGKIFMSPFKNGLVNLEITLTEIEKYINDDNKFSINDVLDYLNTHSKRKMIVVVISDISGLNSISDKTLKKITYVHDLLFINIEDGSLFGDNVFDIDGNMNIPKFIANNKKLIELENSERNRIINENFNRLKRYRVTGVSISNKKEIVSKLIDLLERHNHAVGR